ncbi:ADP-ribosylation factor-like protein 6-interacting protein 6 [Pungitius pungitius]|uniref:ADP-ribosylation factor-like protein 6-interacting protein 6 n=1 Tax=Pungitius pungitius TaxID=134920 RepID=UPI002E14D82E
MPGHQPGNSILRDGSRPWSGVVLSVLGSTLAVAAVGFFCALIYPILRELRADWTEDRILGFWSILVLSLLVGCICCVFSCALTCLDSYPITMVTPTHLRALSDQDVHLGYGVAVVNGLMAMLTVIWSLT